jgi:hypothetical protein
LLRLSMLDIYISLYSIFTLQKNGKQTAYKSNTAPKMNSNKTIKL